jgi:hypothetical protein
MCACDTGEGEEECGSGETINTLHVFAPVKRVWCVDSAHITVNQYPSRKSAE